MYATQLIETYPGPKEFAGFKSSIMTPGWSAVGRQTLSPYVGEIADGETILGHSVRVGPLPIPAIATETNKLEPRRLLNRICCGRGRRF
jgi:hypothetical protein